MSRFAVGSIRMLTSLTREHNGLGSGLQVSVLGVSVYVRFRLC